jgi:hypothetical protein
VEEGLKAVRLLHNVILTASAAVIAFALSPNDLSRLERLSAALSDLRTALVDYDRQAFDRHVEDLVQKETSFKHHLQVTLDGLGISVASDLRATALLPVRTYADLTTARDGRRPPTLFEIDAALRQPRPIEIFKPDDLQSELHKWLAPFAQTTAALHNVRNRGMSGAGRPTVEGYLELRLDPAEYLPQASTIKERIAAADLPFAPRIVADVNPVQIVVDARIHGDFVALRDSFPGWLAGQGKAAVSLDRETGTVKLAPLIVASLEQIGGLSLDEAQQKIDRQREEARERQYVSLLGVDVPAPHALIAAPLTLLILLTYLLSHVRDVFDRATAGDPILRTFPWIGLFGDNQSWVFTVASVVALPLLADLWLFSRLSQSRGWMIWTFASVLLSLTVIQSIVAMWYVKELRVKRLVTGAGDGGQG